MSYPKKCGECHSLIYDNALFCSKCGMKVQGICSQCGNAVADSDLFCHKCGASLKHFQPISEGALVNVAKAIAHRMNNALSIVLTNSQIAARRTAGLPQAIREELQEYLQDIAVAADGGGRIMGQFQRFLDSIADGYSQEEDSAHVDQIVSNLQILAVPESRTYNAKLRSEKPTRVGHVSILIVDDEEKIRHALSYALALTGYNVMTASDGREALTLFRNGSYDVAFVDLKMPGMTGWEVTSAIKQIDPDTMVVLMTGWSVRLDDERLNQNHIDAVLTKPFELSQVNDLITEVGNRR